MPGPARERAEATTEIEDAHPSERRRKECLQTRPFRSAGQSVNRTVELGVALKELGIVVDVLRHFQALVRVKVSPFIIIVLFL